MGNERATVWIELLANRYQQAITAFEQAVRRCPDELWETSMWPVRKDEPWAWPPGPIDGSWHDDLEAAERSIQRASRVSSMAYHAAFHLDFYLSGAVPIELPEPFDESDEFPPSWRPDGATYRVYTRQEILGYLSHCRQKAHTIFGELTDEEAAKPLPADSNHAGMPRGDLLLGNLSHVTEHVAQFNMFLSQQGVDLQAPEKGAWSNVDPAEVLAAAPLDTLLGEQAQFGPEYAGTNRYGRMGIQRAWARTPSFEVWLNIGMRDFTPEAFAKTALGEQPLIKTNEGAQLRELRDGVAYIWELKTANEDAEALVSQIADSTRRSAASQVG